MKRFAVLASLLCFVLGCDSGFTSETEELAYLSSISNPSVSQFRRRVELEKKARFGELDKKPFTREELSAWAKGEEDKKAAEIQAAKNAELKDPSEVNRWMDAAADYESQKDWNNARSCYRDVIEKHPYSPRLQEAKDKLAAIAVN